MWRESWNLQLQLQLENSRSNSNIACDDSGDSYKLRPFLFLILRLVLFCLWRPTIQQCRQLLEECKNVTNLRCHKIRPKYKTNRNKQKNTLKTEKKNHHISFTVSFALYFDLRYFVVYLPRAFLFDEDSSFALHLAECLTPPFPLFWQNYYHPCRLWRPVWTLSLSVFFILSLVVFCLWRPTIQQR